MTTPPYGDETVPYIPHHLRPPRRQRKNHMANPGFVAPRLVGLDLATLSGQPLPVRRWLAQDWIAARTVSMWNAAGGAGKSTLALQLVVACATGQPWLGVPVERCRSVIFACEDDEAELHRRLAAICDAAGVTMADIAEDVLIVCRVGMENALMTWERSDTSPGSATDTFQSIHNAATDIGAGLIVLDSLHDVFTGNENHRGQARQFVGLLRTLATDIDCSVVVLAHPSLSGLNSGSGMSGSTAWDAAVRSRLYMSRPIGDGGKEDEASAERVLTRKKSNYSAAGESMALRWVDGVFERTDLAIPGVVEGIERRLAERAFLEALDHLAKQGRTVSDKSNTTSYAPKAMVRMAACRGLKQRDLERAMLALFDAGEIVVGPAGLYANRSPKLGIVRVGGCTKAAQSESVTH